MPFLHDLSTLIPVLGRRPAPLLWAICVQVMVILLAVIEDAAVAALIAGLAIVQLALIHVRQQELAREKLEAAHATIDTLREDLRHAYTDPVTGLPTRRVAEQHLTAANGTTRTIAVIDVDAMHEFNNTHGHEMGDWLLSELAQRLRGLLGPDDLAARLGGDEFAIISEHDPDTLARLLAVAFGEPLLQGDPSFPASAGICPVAHGSAQRALSCADRAMFTARRRGSRIEVYDPVRDGPPSDATRPRMRLRNSHIQHP